MARYLYGMLQDCTVCSVPVVNKEPFYKKKCHYMRWTTCRVLKLLYLFSCVVVNNRVFCNLLTSFKYSDFRINCINSKVMFVANFV